MFKGNKWFLMLIVLVLLLAFVAGCNGEDVVPDDDDDAIDYPIKDILWVVSRDPGDGQDIIARGIARYLSDELGVNVAVDNMPGAGGKVGFGELNRRAPDGYYIGQDVLGSMANAYALDELDFPLDATEWFAVIYASPAAIWVGANSEIDSIQDLIDLDRPVLIGEGTITGTHVPWTIALLQDLGVDFQYVTGFGGRPEIATACMRLEIDMVSSSVAGYASLIGDLKAIMVMGLERHPLLPDVPTLGEVAKELGMDKINTYLPMGMATYMVGCPPGTPREITAILEDAFQKVIEEDAAFQAWAKEARMDAHFIGYDGTKSMLNAVIKVLQDMGIKEIIEGLR